MEKQSVLKQIGIGAFFGLLFSLISQLTEKSPDPFLSLGFVAFMIGGAIGGILLYMLLYRFWPKNK